MVKLYVTLLLFAGDVKNRLTREDSGATAVEYGLLVGLIAVVIIGAVVALGGTLSGLFTDVNTQIT
jgi:pilus assembly protein Flp/PilA